MVICVKFKQFCLRRLKLLDFEMLIKTISYCKNIGDLK